jgi:hypothetical protein
MKIITISEESMTISQQFGCPHFYVIINVEDIRQQNGLNREIVLNQIHTHQKICSPCP